MLRQMNSFDGKRLLALVREGDYAHAGEEEAIEKVFSAVPKRPDQSMLDVGCGRGGTANYLRRERWGRVAGIDLDHDSIEYARAHYPDMQFDACDVSDVPRILARRFDVIYMLNAFYAFDAQRDALVALRQVAADGARLLIFDYLDRGGFAADHLVVNGAAIVPHPVDLSRTPGDLEEAGWKLISTERLNNEYRQWYADLVRRIELKRAEIIALGGEDAFAYMLAVYGGMLEKIQRGLLGGALLDIVAS
ncbi:MAG TPA: methyltransferase domain-containing protein [Candidatus Binataceae bacterium]|nr:methyltransferase domain-containing protein [Candidatus Binataceae bacterium]